MWKQDEWEVREKKTLSKNTHFELHFALMIPESNWNIQTFQLVYVYLIFDPLHEIGAPVCKCVCMLLFFFCCCLFNLSVLLLFVACIVVVVIVYICRRCYCYINFVFVLHAYNENRFHTHRNRILSLFMDYVHVHSIWVTHTWADESQSAKWKLDIYRIFCFLFSF